MNLAVKQLRWEQERFPIRSHAEVLAEMVPLAGKRILDVRRTPGAPTALTASEGAEWTTVYIDESGRLPLPSGSVDLVTFALSFHHIPESQQERALAEAVRVLAPGGQLYVVEPLAQGPYFELLRTVEDETDARASVRHTLLHASLYGLRPVLHAFYNSANQFRTTAHFVDHAIRVNPGRAAAFQRDYAAASDLFYALGRPVEEGYLFEQTCRLDLFRKG